jgi:hypothetical protein
LREAVSSGKEPESQATRRAGSGRIALAASDLRLDAVGEGPE